ncbi:ATP-dependent Clp protease proteolytic subunit, partial [Sinorhizobium meliloti]
IYVAAPKEQRLCLPNTRFLLHQPSGGTRGMASDIEIQAREIIKMNERLNRIFSEATGQPVDKIAKDTDRDYWLGAEEAKAYGLVSRIVTSIAEI